MVGNSMSTFNLNKMLYNCIEDNEYFQKIRYALTDFQQITEEVAQRVTHVEPWSTGTSRVRRLCVIAESATESPCDNAGRSDVE